MGWLWRRLRLLLLTLLVTASASAQESTRHSVEIVLVGKLGQDPVFAARVSSWFSPERFSVKLRRARYLEPRQVLSPARDADVHVWVTLSGDDLARLYFSSAGGGSPGESVSYFLRDLRLEGGLDEIGAEHVAEVLNLSTQAFLDGQAQSAREELERTLQAEPAPAQEPTPAPARAPPAAPKPATSAAPSARPKRAPASRDWGAGVGYGASYRADEGIWHGPRASIEAIFGRRFGVRLAASAALPHTQELEPLELRFYGASFLVAATFRHQLASNLALAGFAGPALEVVRYEPLRPSSEYAAAGSATEARPGVGAGMLVAVGRTPRLSFIAEVAIPLTKTHYDVLQGSQRRVIGRASPVVPTLGVEIGF